MKGRIKQVSCLNGEKEKICNDYLINVQGRGKEKFEVADLF